MHSLGYRVMGKPALSLPPIFCGVCRDDDPGTSFCCLSQALNPAGASHSLQAACPGGMPAQPFIPLSQAFAARLWLQPKPLGSRHRRALNTPCLQRGHRQSAWEKWLPAMREVNRQIREGRRCLLGKGRSSAFTEFSSSMRRRGSKYLPGLRRLRAGAWGEVPVQGQHVA